MKLKKFSQGFTLVELLVVIAIIGILATLLILQLNTAKARGRDAKRTTDIAQVQTVIEMYYEDNGEYPATLADLDNPKYFGSGKHPTDPLSSTTIIEYGYKVDGSPIARYQIYAELENKNAGAFKGDSDINVPAWSADGTIEACTSAANDCVFDLGVR